MFLSDEERAETILACRFCPMCYVADRVAGLVRRESYTPRGRAAILFALERGLIQWDETVADIMYTTLNDGLLREWCVGNYDHEELVLDARSRLFEMGLAPEQVVKYLTVLRDGKERGPEPGTILRENNLHESAEAEVLLFAGCTLRKSSAHTLASLARIFQKAGEPFKVLQDEPCCGWPFYQLGDRAGAEKCSVELAAQIRSSKAATVAVMDGDCYRMLLTRNARFGGDLSGIRVVHVFELIAGWLETGRLRVAKRIADNVTYHDSCALARYCGDPELPRQILNAVLEGRLLEMETHGKLANCCGAGGMLPVHRPDLAEEVARLRVEEARATGAKILVSGCPRCGSLLEKPLGEAGKPMRAVTLVDLLTEALGLGS
jgi:Fe-S oxidoreductase